MAYVNVAEWSPDQVTDWLKGLDNAIWPYIPHFLNNGVGGRTLLHIRPDELDLLGMTVIGHQEIVLESVEHLRNFHYELDRENLQYLALKLSSAATSLYRELSYHSDDSNKLETQILSNVTNTIATIKPLACWLDRSPFCGQSEYSDKRALLLSLAIEMATNGQRDRFAVQPVVQIRHMARQLADLADEIIQEITDPMLLQPASLDLATLKKRENDLGFSILPNYHGSLQVADIKLGSSAHTCGKIEDGDEIVQVNYQTVVGWQRKKVLMLFQESSLDVLLTLKKRPRHTKIYGQIYMKPYRLPSKKRALPYNRWHDNLPSPRPELLTIPDFEMPDPRPVKPIPEPILDSSDSSDTDSDILTEESPSSNTKISDALRLYLPKPRSVLQRRNTISGSTPVTKRPSYNMDQFWREFKNQKSMKHTGSSYIDSHPPRESDLNLPELSLRDKSVSYGYGLELAPRPKTCLGVNLHTKAKRTDSGSKSETLKADLKTLVAHIDNFTKDDDKSNKDDVKSTKSVRFESDSVEESSYVVNIGGKVLTTNEEIPYVDEEDVAHNESGVLIPQNNCEINVSRSKIGKDRGKLDKSYSTPAYEFEKTGSLDGSSKSGNSDVQKVITEVQLTKEISKMELESTDTRSRYTEMEKHNDEIVEAINTVLVEKRCPEIQSATIKTLNQSSVISNIEIERKPVPEPRKQFVRPLTPPEPPPRPKMSFKPAVPQRKSSLVENKPVLEPNVIIDSPKPHMETLTTPQKLQTHFLFDSEAKNQFFNLGTPKNVLDFEPKTISTPISNDVRNVEKISPSSMGVRSILYTKSRSLKKKNSLLAKRRKVSVKDIESAAPAPIMQGWLYQRGRAKRSSGVTWKRRWYILNDSTLYGFKTMEASKACCLLFLGGYTVCPAIEVKSRPLAFKIYHTGTVFYFSAESSDELSQWLQHISRATLTSDSRDGSDQSALYSETDTSGDEQDVSHPNKRTKTESQSSTKSEGSSNNQANSTEKHQKPDKSHNLKFGSLKKFTRNKSESENNTHSSTSLDRKYLRFFSSKTSHDKSKVSDKNNSKVNHDVPIPTAQFKTYRKIPLTIMSPPPDVVAKPEIQEPKQVSSAEIRQSIMNTDTVENVSKVIAKPIKKLPKPINYIHASNPNLVDFDASDFAHKTSQFKNPSFKSPSRPDNLIGFVTLEQFMLNKQKEEQTEVYSNRVLCGMERDKLKDSNSNRIFKDKSQKREDDIQKQLRNIIPDVIYGEVNQLDSVTLPRKTSNIQNRSLPKTPEQNIPESGFKSNPRKQSNNGFNDGYELIYGEDNGESSTSTKKSKQAKELFKNEIKIDLKIAEPKKNTRKNSADSSSSSVSDIGKNLRKQSDVDSVSNITTKSTNLILNRQQSLNCDKKSKRSSTDKSSNMEMERKLSLNLKAPDVSERKHVFNHGESPEKYWIDSLRRNDRVHVKGNDVKMYGKHDIQLKSAAQYIPMNLPLNSKITNQFSCDINLEKSESSSTSSISKLKNMFHKNNHDTSSNKSKHNTPARIDNSNKKHLSSSDKNVKEKTLLGSPKLHRAIFGKNVHNTENNWTEMNTGNFRKQSYNESFQTNSSMTQPSFGSSNILTLNSPSSNFSSNSNSTVGTPDYPNLEYPPVFEPETYSLSDPNTSFTLLRKRNNN